MNYKKTVIFCNLFLVISNLVVYLYSDNNNEKPAFLVGAVIASASS